MEIKIAITLIIVALTVFPALFIIRRRIDRD
jgi:hypothetical protein